MPYFYKSPSGTSSGALGRRDFVRPEFIAMPTMWADPAGVMSRRAGIGLGFPKVWPISPYDP
eukprot:2374264-Prymnesium_polylepis.1